MTDQTLISELAKLPRLSDETAAVLISKYGIGSVEDLLAMLTNAESVKSLVEDPEIRFGNKTAEIWMNAILEMSTEIEDAPESEIEDEEEQLTLKKPGVCIIINGRTYSQGESFSSFLLPGETIDRWRKKGLV